MGFVTGIAARRFALPLRTYVLTGAALIVLQALILYAMVWVPICGCGTVKLWHGIVQSSENSQHIFDWYSFSHILHGFVFYWCMRVLVPGGPVGLWLVLSIAFREFLGSSGKHELHHRAVSRRHDLARLLRRQHCQFGGRQCGDGVRLCRGAPVADVDPGRYRRGGRSGLLWWIRDNLTLNIVMLLYPIPGIRAWQAGGALQ